jgi:hypothetical protein
MANTRACHANVVAINAASGIIAAEATDGCCWKYCGAPRHIFTPRHNVGLPFILRSCATPPWPKIVSGLPRRVARRSSRPFAGFHPTVVDRPFKALTALRQRHEDIDQGSAEIADQADTPKPRGPLFQRSCAPASPSCRRHREVINLVYYRKKSVGRGRRHHQHSQAR